RASAIEEVDRSSAAEQKLMAAELARQAAALRSTTNRSIAKAVSVQTASTARGFADLLQRRTALSQRQIRRATALAAHDMNRDLVRHVALLLILFLSAALAAASLLA